MRLLLTPTPRRHLVRACGAALGTILLLAGQPAGAQRLSYSSGQNVSPAFEGWEEDVDGSRHFLFGYMNRNWQETPTVPVGAENNIEPGGPDLGQPTHFLPRRNRFVFRVPVPDDFGADDEMVWTLTVNSVTERAFATLSQDYFVDNIVRASEQGALGAGTSNPTIRANVGPPCGWRGRRSAPSGWVSRSSSPPWRTMTACRDRAGAGFCAARRLRRVAGGPAPGSR